MLSHDELAVQGMTAEITAAIDARSAFETEKHGASHNIHKTLSKVRKALMWNDTSRVMLAANVDPAFINRTLHDGSRYNVYTVDKVADAVRGLVDGAVSNAINRACMVSLLQMRRAGIPFTGGTPKPAPPTRSTSTWLSASTCSGTRSAPPRRRHRPAAPCRRWRRSGSCAGKDQPATRPSTLPKRPSPSSSRRCCSRTPPES